MPLIDNPVSSALDLVKSVAGPLIKHFFPDPEKQAEANLELEKLEQSGDLQKIAGQLNINLEESKSASLFIAGWRPAVGWVGAVSLGLAYIPKAVVLTIFWCMQAYTFLRTGSITGLPPFPDLGVADIIGLLGAILGIGTLRTYEKKTNCESNR